MPIQKRARSKFEYRSCLRDWDASAGVRVRPRRALEEEEAEGKLYFSSHLVPYINHPLIARLGPAVQRELIIQHLYHYLEFTANFEIEVVNREAQRIAFGKSEFSLPQEMLFDAYKIYCDEGYHSFFSVDFGRQVEAVTGIKPLPYDFGNFMRRLTKTREGLPSDLDSVSRLLTVIVFETLISMILNQIPKDTQVIGAVRKLVSDHADDEARHHAFFSMLLDVLWPQLSREQQSTLGPLLPGFIIKSLEPDFASIKQRLAAFGLRTDEIEQTIEESYPAPEVIAGLRRTACATIRLFERNGLLEEPGTLDAFQTSGLLG